MTKTLKDLESEGRAKTARACAAYDAAVNRWDAERAALPPPATQEQREQRALDRDEAGRRAYREAQ